MKKNKSPKKNNYKRQRKTKVRAIPNNLDKDFANIGDGDWKQGMYVSVEAWKILHKNPEEKIMHDVDVLMTDLRLHYGDNHFDHFDNFPAVMRLFLKSGYPDFSIMTGKRFEKPLKEFDKDAKDD